MINWGGNLARLLQVHDITCTVFELEQTPNDRDQGGTVDLYRRGQLALQEAGLIDEYKRLTRPGEVMKLRYDGTVIFDENQENNRRPEEYADRPEIDRTKLRHLLLDSFKLGTVVWGKKLKSVDKSPLSFGQWTSTNVINGSPNLWKQAIASCSMKDVPY
ncbi:uncharacterized protein Z518_02283 [Rhinocladiella mackenziei CBS 650.93]|uniref:FAD-binding domain-containing protein n=1 Tax=Rhinocladiella mackenziei CBS 650.93 TaxID=1442369 RepID=A0A0D2JEL8_9EURO|nr:uncharacterized protein Z518_02283 [Rhinocladiella mackenziei CBS 650.93]KIX07630.1 hypothetical protein Z518_02283 [Rhinocladiella mackenziei CBS 650.93]